MRVGVLVEPHLRGAENMARDEALLAAGEPVVRLYGWRPACVSLGRAQTEADVDLDAARAWGMDVVRRATGGGAILHNEEEVTYAVVLPLAALPRDISGSFSAMSAGVVETLRALGLPAEIESVPDNTRETLCYVRKQGTNVMVGGRKISGGAQRRSDKAVLQHGTLIVKRDEERMARLFGAPVEQIRERVTSLEEEGIHLSREKLVEALAAGFERALSQTSIR